MMTNLIVKTIRKEPNISQETLANEINVSDITLNRWGNNKSKPSRLAMDKLKDYCATNKISNDVLIELGKYR